LNKTEIKDKINAHNNTLDDEHETVDVQKKDRQLIHIVLQVEGVYTASNNLSQWSWPN